MRDTDQENAKFSGKIDDRLKASSGFRVFVRINARWNCHNQWVQHHPDRVWHSLGHDT
jgi:hypothetical protein